MTHRDARTPVPCRSCKRPMIWATLPSGKACPFDADFDPVEGTHVLNYRQATNQVFAVPVNDDNPEDGARARRSHFKTCPDAASFSHKAKPRGKTTKIGDALKDAIADRKEPDDAEDGEP